MEAILGAEFGHVRVEVRKGRVTDVDLRDEPVEGDQIPEGFPPYVLEAVRAYLEGRAPRPIAPFEAEGTAFEQSVWRALEDIPTGETVTYGQLAERIGRPGAARAVGQALAKNPLPLVRPCHRVVASDGLGGFGGCSSDSEEGKIEVKRWLLEHERIRVGDDEGDR